MAPQSAQNIMSQPALAKNYMHIGGASRWQSETENQMLTHSGSATLKKRSPHAEKTGYIKKLGIYLLVNSLVALIAATSTGVLKFLDRYHAYLGQFLPHCGASLFRNTLTVCIVVLLTRKRTKLHGQQRRSIPVRDYAEMIARMAVFGTLGDAMATYYAHNLYAFREPSSQLVMDILLFIPQAFIFEIVLDFFHYWAHRVCHNVTWLYQKFHKTHHKHPHPHPLSAFQQDPFDLLATNLLPFTLALAFSPPFAERQLPLLVAYKIYIEVAGHSGVDSRACTFPQLTFLPRIFGIAMHTKDHDVHHSSVHCNFSKRFILWDKVFGTYKDASSSKAA